VSETLRNGLCKPRGKQLTDGFTEEKSCSGALHRDMKNGESFRFLQIYRDTERALPRLRAHSQPPRARTSAQLQSGRERGSGSSSPGPPLVGAARAVAGSRARAEEEAEGHRRRDDFASELPVAAADLARAMALPRSAMTTCSPAQARAPPSAPWRAELERRGGGGARAPRSEEGRGGRGTARSPGSDPPEVPARLAGRRRRAQEGGRSLRG